jgi:hypothetical protein
MPDMVAANDAPARCVLPGLPERRFRLSSDEIIEAGSGARLRAGPPWSAK